MATLTHTAADLHASHRVIAGDGTWLALEEVVMHSLEKEMCFHFRNMDYDENRFPALSPHLLWS